GRLAEHHFGCTVHVLDDGFQHFHLHRDADLVVLDRDDLHGAVTLPSGHLREPIDAASAADALIALDDADAGSMANGRPLWRARRRQGGGAPASGPAVAVAGIARPQAFFDALRARGWTIAGELAFRDHHRYSRGDLDRIFETARRSQAAAIVTTDKDLVRLLP